MSSQGGGKQHSASQHRHRTDSTGESPSSAAAPNVRHIPIYVEGRDEPLINRNIDIGASAPASNHQPHHHSVHRSASASAGAAPTTSNFEWARKFPTMGAQASYEQQSPPVPVPQPPQPQQPHSQPQRSNSPIRTSGSSPNAGGTNGSPQQPQTYQQQPQPYQQQPQPYQPADVPLQQSPQSTSNQQTTSAKQRNNNNRRNNGGGGNSNSPSPANGAPIETAADLATIKKIQVIQVDMLELMDQVERFAGGNRKDRQYMYLDEMLTQNLLKLDTIDADGKDNIKLARREAIRCINKCIGVLEAKADAAIAQENAQAQAQAQAPSGGGKKKQQQAGNKNAASRV